ncbi:hypothetical protein [Parapedobacter koreensis]|nr:hypothetical protein [Parapedobacter koreensis]
MSIKVADTEFGPAVYVGRDISATVQYARKNGINGLIVAEGGNYPFADVNFLQNCSFVETLVIQRYGHIDLTGIHALSALKKLALNITANDKQPIDFSCFPQLEVAKFTWRPKAKSLFDCKSLRYLRIEKFNKRDLEDLGGLSNLEILKVVSSPIKTTGDIDSIKPIRSLKKLKDFRFWESTNVLDGDMTPCIGVKTVAFKNRPHYTHTKEEIDEINKKQQ